MAEICQLLEWRIYTKLEIRSLVYVYIYIYTHITIYPPKMRAGKQASFCKMWVFPEQQIPMSEHVGCAATETRVPVWP